MNIRVFDEELQKQIETTVFTNGTLILPKPKTPARTWA